MREARKLRSSHENIELLKEKLLEERGRRERSESELLKLSEIQLSAKNLEDELSSWRSMMKDIPGVSCADDIPSKFAALQKYVSNLILQFVLHSTVHFFIERKFCSTDTVNLGHPSSLLRPVLR